MGVQKRLCADFCFFKVRSRAVASNDFVNEEALMQN